MSWAEEPVFSLYSSITLIWNTNNQPYDKYSIRMLKEYAKEICRLYLVWPVSLAVKQLLLFFICQLLLLNGEWEKGIAIGLEH